MPNLSDGLAPGEAAILAPDAAAVLNLSAVLDPYEGVVLTLSA